MIKPAIFNPQILKSSNLQILQTQNTSTTLPHLPPKLPLIVYILAIIALGALPLNSSSSLNNITVLQLRGDYFFHILLFLPWMFLHNPAFGNLRPGRSFWPLAFSFWSDGKTKGKRQKEKGKSTLAKSLSQSLSQSQHLSWLLTGLLFASATEGLQYFLPWRAFNVNDLLANGLGVLLGWGLIKLYEGMHRNQQTQK